MSEHKTYHSSSTRQSTMIVACDFLLFQMSVSTNQNVTSIGSIHHTVPIQSNCVCSLHNVVQLMENNLTSTRLHTVKCVAMRHIDPTNWVSQIFSLTNGWTLLHYASSQKLTVLLQLVPNTYGFCVIFCGRRFINNMRYSLSCECGKVRQQQTEVVLQQCSPTQRHLSYS